MWATDHLMLFYTLGPQESWTIRETGVRLTTARKNSSGGINDVLLCALRPSTALLESATRKVLQAQASLTTP